MNRKRKRERAKGKEKWKGMKREKEKESKEIVLVSNLERLSPGAATKPKTVPR